MMCPSPESVPRPGGSGSRDRVTVPCGKCEICLQNKRNAWKIRLENELRVARNGRFVTLTYSDEFAPKDSQGVLVLRKNDVQLFLKRLRQSNHKAWLDTMKEPIVDPSSRQVPQMRYFCVGEYGPSTSRPHYHLIIFNLHYWAQIHLETFWEVGFVKVDDLIPARMEYITKYFINTVSTEDDKQKKPFVLVSKGFGLRYVEVAGKTLKKQKIDYYRTPGGGVMNLPQYYRNKIFNKFERKTMSVKRFNEAEKLSRNLHQKLRDQGDDPFLVIQQINEHKKQKIRKSLKSNKL